MKILIQNLTDNRKSTIIKTYLICYTSNNSTCNTNKLLKSYNGITGLKTGTTSQAGSCISATAERDGLSLVAVVLGSETGTDRFKAAATLLDYGFANYKKTKLTLPEDAPMEIKVKNGMENSVQLKYEIPKDILLQKNIVSIK